MPDVLLEEGPVATVTLNRPERRNALTAAAAAAVADAVERAAASARAIVLTGTPPAFCAGGDRDELRRLAAAAAGEGARALYDGYQRMILAVRRAPAPVVAAVNGHAMGAGLDLALACDLRVASSEARLGEVWARLGLMPGTGGAFWATSLAGPGRAAELVLAAEPVGAETALGWGLVNEVVGPEEVLPRARAIAERIAGLPPAAVAACKRALDEVLRPGYEAALAHAREVQPELFGGPGLRSALDGTDRRG